MLVIDVPKLNPPTGAALVAPNDNVVEVAGAPKDKVLEVAGVPNVNPPVVAGVPNVKLPDVAGVPNVNPEACVVAAVAFGKTFKPAVLVPVPKFTFGVC